jgi:predicted Kef-type K+ transport protein
VLTAALAAALVLGIVAWRFGLPPLVGFLLTGFLFSALDFEAPAMLHEIADAGILLLLFAVGLKLRFKTLFRLEVWGTAIVHLLIVGAVMAGALTGLVGMPWQGALVLAIAFGFSSTVLAAKVLESANELRAVHGRVAIGILIVQDLVAVAALASFSAEIPSPYAALWLLLPLLRPVLYRVLDLVGHAELLVLFGAVAAIVIGGSGFELVGLSPALGALLIGVLLANHRRAQELSNAIWSLKELFLIGFIPRHRSQGVPVLGDAHAVPLGDAALAFEDGCHVRHAAGLRPARENQLSDQPQPREL